MNKIDFKKMKGEDLFYYFTAHHHDKEYSSIVALLQYVFDNPQDAFELLERCVRENKVLVAVYPGEEKTDTSGMEYVGSIPDGMLYVN